MRKGSLRRHIHDDGQLAAFCELGQVGLLALDGGEGVLEDVLARSDVSMRCAVERLVE